MESRTVKKSSPTKFGIPALVAKPIPRKDRAGDKFCQEAIENEWRGLNNPERPVFDMKSVKSWREVASEANAKNKTIHMARVFGIMVRKHAENAEIAKTKYRVVYQGNAVFTHKFEVAFFKTSDHHRCLLKVGTAWFLRCCSMIIS